VDPVPTGVPGALGGVGRGDGVEGVSALVEVIGSFGACTSVLDGTVTTVGALGPGAGVEEAAVATSDLTIPMPRLGMCGCRPACWAEPVAVETTHHDPTMTRPSATIAMVTHRRPLLCPASHLSIGFSGTTSDGSRPSEPNVPTTPTSTDPLRWGARRHQTSTSDSRIRCCPSPIRGMLGSWLPKSTSAG
jgi:hypothetical protein